MHVGAPSCGMNAAVRYARFFFYLIYQFFNFMFLRSFTKNCYYGGHVPLGIHNGIDGLINDEVKQIGWGDVSGWIAEVGAR